MDLEEGPKTMRRAMPGLFLKSCLVLVILATMHGPSLSCPDHQRNALLQFKSLLPGNRSTEMGLETWDPNSPDCCNWSRVDCAFPDNTVTGLILSYDRFVNYGVEPEPISSNVLAPLFHVRTLTELDLSYNQIDGQIPGTGLANLTQLLSLDLGGNRFSGLIPWQLFSLNLLECLYLNDNMIEGNLDDRLVDGSDVKIGIGSLTRLKDLDLQDNRLGGIIPKSISNLKNLELLMLGNNSFSQEIPSSIGRLSNLSVLLLNNNNLSGVIPSSIQMLHNLETLYLNENLLIGEIPSWLFEMKSLINLDLGDNNLTFINKKMAPKSLFYKISLRSCSLSGEIPFWFANQSLLQFLDLSDNYLIGNIPQWLTNASLMLLSLSDNMLSGPLPPSLFGSLNFFETLEPQNLFALDLGRNNFSGPLPNSIGNAIFMRLLMLPGNNLSGPLPKSMSNMSSLVVLDLSSNSFSGNDLPFINAPLLTSVHLFSNGFSGKVPVTFGPRAKTLVLSQNEFFGILPPNLTRLNQLKYLDLHENNIVGELPAFLFNLSLLEVLNIRNNSFRGSIPSDISKFSNLQILDLSCNNLSGEIPSSLGNLLRMSSNHGTSSALFTIAPVIQTDPILPISMAVKGIDQRQVRELEVFWKKLKQRLPGHHLQMYTFLDLSTNQLSGQIPSTLGSLKELKSLNLSHNQLSEHIPLSLGQLQGMESLDLSYNHLTGEIPPTFSNLLELSYLDLSNNKLEGPIPSGPQMDRLNDPSFYANNNGLCGAQIKVVCKEALAVGPQLQESKNEEETWFSWRMAGVGFPIGFFTTILGMYGIGFFTFSLQRPPHYYVMGQNFSFVKRRT